MEWLYKFYNNFMDDFEDSGFFIFFGFISSVAALVYSIIITDIASKIILILLWLILAEWFFISIVRNEKGINNIWGTIGTKFLALIGTMPLFIVYLLGIFIYHRIGKIDWYNALIVLGLISLVVFGVMFYFFVNYLIVKKIREKDKRKR